MAALSSRHYVCVHAGSRDDYQVAQALRESGRLDRLVTDYYSACVPAWLNRALGRFRPTRRALGRLRTGLGREDVEMSWPTLAVGALDRTGRDRWFTPWRDRLLGEHAGRRAGKSGASVLAYSYYADAAFRTAPASAAKVIFQVHPHPDTVREILREEQRCFPAAAYSLAHEQELSLPPAILARLQREALMADWILTPSTFAKTSLIAAGVHSGRIRVVPYGVDAASFKEREDMPVRRGPLRVICVGAIVQRKGIGYLLEAGRQLGTKVQITLAGRGFIDRPLLNAFQDVNVRIAWDLSRDELQAELAQADVFVLPSLAESFALVILEAMAVGLPVVTTANTGAPDLFTHGTEGFIGKIRDVGFLVRSMQHLHGDRDAACRMGLAAAKRAREWTWSRFRAAVNSALDEFEAARP